jgi:hypothetical protein
VTKKRWIVCEEKKQSLGERLSYCFEVLHRRTSQEPGFWRTDHGPCSAMSTVRRWCHGRIAQAFLSITSRPQVSVARVRGVSGKIGRNQPSASRRSSAIFPGFKPLGDVWLSSPAHAQTRYPDDCSVEWLEPHVGNADLNQASSQRVWECRVALTQKPCLWH